MLWAVIAVAVVVLVGGGAFVALKGSRGPSRQPGAGEALASPRPEVPRNDGLSESPIGGTPAPSSSAVSFEDPAPERTIARAKAPEAVEPSVRRDVNRPVEVEAREQPKQAPTAVAKAESAAKAKAQAKRQANVPPRTEVRAQPVAKPPVTERPAPVTPLAEATPKVAARPEPVGPAETDSGLAADTEPGRPLTGDVRRESGSGGADGPTTVTSGLFDADPDWHQPDDEWEDEDDVTTDEPTQGDIEREKLERVVQSASSRAEELAPSVTARNRPVDASS